MYHYETIRWDRRTPRTGWQPTDFQRGAIEAAFFTCDPFLASGEYVLDWSATWNRLSEEDRARFIGACEAFEKRYGRALSAICERTGNDMETAGRDYHYTSQGHGCGFWDGDWGKFGDALTNATERSPLPEVHADLECKHYHETGSPCGECEACEEQAVSYWVE